MPDPKDKDPNAVPGITDNPIVKGVNAVAKGAKKVADAPGKAAHGVSGAGRAAFNSFVRVDQKADKGLRKVAKKLNPFAEGGSVDGPALLHVGERPHGDKNYETSEVVLAAPGTVVAPIPKGMPVTPESAAALLMMQIMKGMGGGDAPKRKPRGAASGFDSLPGNSGFASGYSSAFPGMTPKYAGSAPGSAGGAGGSRTTPWTMSDILGLLNSANTATGNAAQYKVGMGQNQNQSTNIMGNLDLARAKQSYDFNHPDSPSYSTANAGSSAADQESRGMAQAKFNLDMRQGATNDAIKWAQLQLDRELGQGSLANQRQSEADQNNFWQGQLSHNRDQLAFDQLIRGISEGSTPGVRAGRLPATSF